MGVLSPLTAAELAEKIYSVQSSQTIALKAFLARPEFSQKSNSSTQLSAKVGLRLLSTQASFGLCVRGGAAYEDDLFLIFRGTTSANYGAEIISDLRLGIETSKTGLPVHVGFNSAFCSMIAGIEEFLDKNTDALGTIHVIGHSLGGAVAAIAADWLSSRENTVKLYTFGAPKPGLEFFADRLTAKLGKENIYRVYHTTDVVPMVPVYPFSHSPVDQSAYAIPGNSFISLAAHRMVNYIAAVKTASWDSLNSIGERIASERSVEQWLKSGVPINPADPRTWEWINASLTWVLRKIMGGAAVCLQAPIISSLSIADKIAYVLRKGIDLSLEASGWVLRLMRKIMTALGIKLVNDAAELTQLFMRNILKQLIERMSAEVMRVIRALIVQV